MGTPRSRHSARRPGGSPSRRIDAQDRESPPARASWRTRASLFVLRHRFRQHRFPLLIEGAQLEPPITRRLGPERHGVAGHDHACEPDREPAQATWTTRRFRCHRGQQSHLEHAVRDEARQPDRASELVVEMDRVVVTGHLRIFGDLFARERDAAFGHERITKRVRDRHTGAPFESELSASKDTKRMPRRLLSEATRPRDVTVSPARGWRSHSNSCSAWSSRAKSTAASSSANRAGTATPSEYTAAKVGGTPSAGAGPHPPPNTGDRAAPLPHLHRPGRRPGAPGHT